uniref:Uncharacterized protein n=1 Tax=Anguilla anguilla TaxID=7936 RepID=A0A0E9PV83_ANGAN
MFAEGGELSLLKNKLLCPTVSQKLHKKNS